MDEALVQHFLERLKRSIGDRAEFVAVFDEIIRHPNVRQLEACGMARVLLGRLPAGTTRREALTRISSHYSRLFELADFHHRKAA